MADAFGSLENWGLVLETMEELKKKKMLDDHQPALARLLRYPYNPRLSWAALSAAKEITQASDVLIADVLAILVSREAITPHRVLAAEALGHLVPRRVAPAQPADLDIERVVAAMSDVAKTPGPPVVVEAVEAALEAIKSGNKSPGK
ncbi:MAG: hypothetical protein M0R80_10795 [Proteobacteria bacterium]|jgi:hypothetical protein|nr:hypothetical protein [Pseudomonadota bacterium]